MFPISNPDRKGQLWPLFLARRTDSATVKWLAEQLLAICRLLRPHSHLTGSLAPRHACIRWPDYRVMGGRVRVKSLDRLLWNQWTEGRGIRSLFHT
jgi:hypothetical protein